MTNIIASLFLSILPIVLVAVLLIFIVRRSKKFTPADYAAQRKLPRTPFARADFLIGLFWVGLGIFNLLIESRIHSGQHGTTSTVFQHLYGGFGLIFGGFLMGTSVPKAFDAKKTTHTAKQDS